MSALKWQDSSIIFSLSLLKWPGEKKFGRRQAFEVTRRRYNGAAVAFGRSMATTINGTAMLAARNLLERRRGVAFGFVAGAAPDSALVLACTTIQIAQCSNPTANTRRSVWKVATARQWRQCSTASCSQAILFECRLWHSSPRSACEYDLLGVLHSACEK